MIIINCIYKIMGYEIPFLVILCARSCFSTEAYKGPENSAFLRKHNATLKCRDDHASEKTKPVWKFHAVNSKLPKTIYEDGQIVIDDRRYSVDETFDKQYDLTINNTDEKVAGSYTCQTSNDSYSARLVILASNPICEKQSYQNGKMDKISEVELKCSVQFWGGWPPTFQWQIVNGSELDASNIRSTNDTVMSSVIVSVNLTHDEGIVVQCTTYFAQRTWTVEMAKNVPNYQYIWTSRISFRSWFDMTTEEKIYGTSTHSGLAGEINTGRKEVNLPDLFPIVATMLLSIICVLLLVALVAFIKVKCFQGNNTYSHRHDKENVTEISTVNQSVDIAMGLQMQPLEKVEELGNHFQRGSSEYYCQIDDSLIGEFGADNPDTVDPDLHLKLGYIDLHDDAIDEVGTTSYDECSSSVRTTQVHMYEGRVVSADQEDSNVVEPKASSYDQLGTTDRSEPSKQFKYKCLDTKLTEPGYLQLQNDEREDVGIANYEQYETSGHNPVHLYGRRRDIRDQEERDDLESKVSTYDQLEPTHRSKRIKPSEYKRLDTGRVEPAISP